MAIDTPSSGSPSSDRKPSDPLSAPSPSASDVVLEVDLKNPWTAALLAWLWPGAGHLYQRRYGKGMLFMVCILSTFFFGLALGGGRCVYASFRKPDVRYPYILQFPVGLPALPAVIQNFRVRRQREPLLGGLMAPPEIVAAPDQHDMLSFWNEKYGFRFEVGTLYTMIAGLLNVLAIYDAFAGPMLALPDGKKAGRQE